GWIQNDVEVGEIRYEQKEIADIDILEIHRDFLPFPFRRFICDLCWSDFLCGFCERLIFFGLCDLSGFKSQDRSVLLLQHNALFGLRDQCARKCFSIFSYNGKCGCQNRDQQKQKRYLFHAYIRLIISFRFSSNSASEIIFRARSCSNSSNNSVAVRDGAAAAAATIPGSRSAFAFSIACLI